jgi:uncharacterized membrane protein
MRDDGPIMEPITHCPACGHELSMLRNDPPSRAEHYAMRVASAVASWWFVAALVVLIFGWVVLNVVARPFTPYPTVMLAGISATLASVAALQGPLILLSQRRAADRDRRRDDEALRVAINAEGDLHRVEGKLDQVLAGVPVSSLDSRTPKSV